MGSSCHCLISQLKPVRYASSQPQMPQSALLAIPSSQIDHRFRFSLPNTDLFFTPYLLLSHCHMPHRRKIYIAALSSSQVSSSPVLSPAQPRPRGVLQHAAYHKLATEISGHHRFLSGVITSHFTIL